ncbi:hypothetical protein EYF80_020907 [Liparis tanakae]|uniref:Uncharacterized protein n=1 Tax=Liparis tanakae TaxID=230148 RepID=A0A4Z2HVD7_9TELE|nr:hypothetical protein EYF80_020907 [Liparis tanakae]
MELGARGKWEMKMQGRDKGKEGAEAELKVRRRWSPRESGMEEKEGGERGKVWKQADRTGYAQKGSRAQAQT